MLGALVSTTKKLTMDGAHVILLLRTLFRVSSLLPDIVDISERLSACISSSTKSAHHQPERALVLDIPITPPFIHVDDTEGTATGNI